MPQSTAMPSELSASAWPLLLFNTPLPYSAADRHILTDRALYYCQKERHPWFTGKCWFWYFRGWVVVILREERVDYYRARGESFYIFTPDTSACSVLTTTPGIFNALLSQQIRINCGIAISTLFSVKTIDHVLLPLLGCGFCTCSTNPRINRASIF